MMSLTNPYIYFKKEHLKQKIGVRRGLNILE
jgi:hypothetical protein